MLSVAFHPIYKYSLPDGHRFPMDKYYLLPQQLIKEGICSQEDFFEPEKALSEIITKVHTEEYYKRLQNLALDKKEIRKIGFPL